MSAAMQELAKATKILAEAEPEPAPVIHNHIDLKGVTDPLQSMGHALSEMAKPPDLTPIAEAVKAGQEATLRAVESIASRPQQIVVQPATVQLSLPEQKEMVEEIEILERDGSGRMKKARKSRRAKE